jgi:hypothetical protein
VGSHHQITWEKAKRMVIALTGNSSSLQPPLVTNYHSGMKQSPQEDNHVTPLAITNYSDIRKRFGIRQKNRRGHM